MEYKHFEVFYTPGINNFDFIVLLLKRTWFSEKFNTKVKIIYGRLLPSYQDNNMVVRSMFSKLVLGYILRFSVHFSTNNFGHIGVITHTTNLLVEEVE